MHQSLKDGKVPGGYRANWLKDSALLMIDVLGQIAKDFDTAHSDDKCSAADLLDILATAAGIIKDH
jgi:hypothetical protein